MNDENIFIEQNKSFKDDSKPISSGKMEDSTLKSTLSPDLTKINLKNTIEINNEEFNSDEIQKENFLNNENEIINELEKKFQMTEIKEEESYINYEVLTNSCTLISEFIYDLLLDSKDKIDGMCRGIGSNSKCINKLLEEKILFYSSKIPNLSINEYLVRLAQYSKLEENEILFLGLIMKVLKEDKNILISINNVYKLINAALMITVKFLKDKKFRNNDYSRITGESVKDLMNLEYNLLVLLDFNIFTVEKLFNSFKDFIYEEYNQYIQMTTK